MRCLAIVGVLALAACGRQHSPQDQAVRDARDVAAVEEVNRNAIKPLDTDMLERFARQCKVLCTFEDHVLHNGFGCGVIEHLNDAGLHTQVVRIGWPDEFIEHGTVPILRQKHGLTAQHAFEKITKALEASKSPAA